MSNRKLLILSGAGAFITGICCFTPALVILLAAVGINSLTAWLDWTLPGLFMICAILFIDTLIRARV